MRILRGHPGVSIELATAQSHAGARLSDVFPVPWDVRLVPEADADPGRVDAIFCCLPAGAAMAQAARARAAGAKVIDLSADFRLRDPAAYQHWYGLAHSAPQLLSQAVYGLPEVHSTEIRQAGLVANPGCYPTSVLLGLYPLLKAGLIQRVPIIADCKSGVSGAGRTLSLRTHFVEANENLSPYQIGRSHRHLPEMEQEIEQLGGPPHALIFTPHLAPISRGMLCTLYLAVPESLPQSSLHKLFNETYARAPFVWVLPEGQLASVAHAVRTNRCALSVTLAAPGQLIVCSAIDNLVKGAAGQAVQNFNLMFGLDESAGLMTL
jgi:N-acetyl-gamma-glutamyl-phosphate reductase